MRRVGLGLAGIMAAVAFAAGATLAARVPDGDPGERLLAGLRDATGLTIEANGAAKLSLFPRPTVRIDGISVSRPGDAPFAVARELTGSLDLGALLAGRFELAEITLLEPQVALDRLPFENAAAAFRGRSVAAGPSLRILDGRFLWSGGMVDRVEAGMASPREGGPLTLSGYGRFASRKIEATVQVGDLSALLKTGRAAFRARIEGGGAKLLFDGEALDGGDPRLVGEISARAASLADTLGWLGARRSDGSAAPMSLSFAGHGGLDRAGLQISNAEVDLAGQSFLGAGRLTSTSNGLPSLEATLDAETLDLGAYLGALAPELRSADGRWSAAPVDLDGLKGWTLDLRLSADRMRFGQLAFGETAATVAIASGGLDLSIGEAAAFGGSLGGRISLEPQGAAVRMRLEGAATDVAADDAVQSFAGSSPIAGEVTADVSLEGSGATVAELVSSLSGRGFARVADGALEGVGRSRALALLGLGDRMAFSNAEARMTFERGIARANDVSIIGPAATFALSGSASLVDLDVKLTGSARPAGQGWTLPVLVEGPMSAPRLRADLGRGKPRGEVRRHDAPGPMIR